MAPIRQIVTVQADGEIRLRSAGLRPGMKVEVIVQEPEAAAPTPALTVAERRKRRIKIDPDLAKEIAESPEFLPEES